MAHVDIQNFKKYVLINLSYAGQSIESLWLR